MVKKLLSSINLSDFILNKKIFVLICIFMLFIISSCKNNETIEYSTNAGININNKFYELDNIYKNEISPEYDIYKNEKVIIDDDYKSLKEKIGIDLLDSSFSQNNSFMIGEIDSTSSNYTTIVYENYILGDTKNHKLDAQNLLVFDAGEKFKSPISISLSILSYNLEKNNRYDKDYLGKYELLESYKSSFGSRVFIINVGDEKDNNNFIAKKEAIFIADGIIYELKGRVSLEMMKEIVDSMYK